MNDELEFSISQHLDGTLPPAETAALEQRLGSDPEARELLVQYRKLDEILKTTTTPLPNVPWDRLANQISKAIDESESQEPASYPMPWVRRIVRVAIAACIVLGIGIGIKSYLARQTNSNGTVAPSVAVIEVEGPKIEVAAAKVVGEITIGPAALASTSTPSARYADSVVSRPSRVLIASGLDASDTDHMPY